MEMEKFFREKFTEFLEQNNQQIISNEEVTNLRQSMAAKVEELKNCQEALKKLLRNHHDKIIDVEVMREKLKNAEEEKSKIGIKLTEDFVCKLKYKELEDTVSFFKDQLEAVKETISQEKAMKLEMEQQVKELQTKLNCVEEREHSVDALRKDLLFNQKRLEKKLEQAEEATLKQVKLNEKLRNEKEQLDKQFRMEKIGTRWEIVALKDEIERLTMGQFKFIAFVREIVNASDFEEYMSNNQDVHSICGQLDNITYHVKNQFEKLKKDLIELKQQVNQENEPDNMRPSSQENVGQETTSSNTSITSINKTPLPSSEQSHQIPQQQLHVERARPKISKICGKARSPVATKRTTKIKTNVNKGVKVEPKRSLRLFLKRKKHAKSEAIHSSTSSAALNKSTSISSAALNKSNSISSAAFNKSTSISSATLSKSTSISSVMKDACGQIHRAVVTVSDTEADTSSSDRDNERPIYPCRCTCGIRCQSAFAFQYHIKRIEYKNAIQCVNCFEKFQTFYFLKKHMAEKHEKLYKKYKGDVGCSLCGEQFSSMKNFNIHFAKEHEGKSRDKNI